MSCALGDRVGGRSLGSGPPEAPADEPGARPGSRPAELILVVDDEPVVQGVMRRWFRSNGHRVICVSRADQALALAAIEAPAVALCDVHMPGHDGLWLASCLRRAHPETAVIMITGVHDVAAAVAGLRQGVVDYLTKPFSHDRLRDAVARALEWHRAACDRRDWRARLAGDAADRQARLSRVVQEGRVASDAGVEALAQRLARVDAAVAAHASRVAGLSVAIAQTLGMSADDLPAIRHGALLHDIGRLALPEAILQKPAPLTPDEEALVRRHPVVGAGLLAVHGFLTAATVIVRTVQERPDGHGYPEALSGEAVPLAAQIVAAADAYDTMTHPRIFRAARRATDALAEMHRCSGTQFNSRVVSALERLITG